MKVYDLWCICPESHVYIKFDNGDVVEYCGGKKYAYRGIEQIRATSYPNMHSVIEINLNDKL